MRKALILGGDEPEAIGPYADGAALLREDLFTGCGLREVGLPGYPEGHPRIRGAALERAFGEKLLLAAKHGLGTYVVTQFSFAPARIVDYCAVHVECNVVGVHVFTFGGVTSSAAWMNRYIASLGNTA